MMNPYGIGDEENVCFVETTLIISRSSVVTVVRTIALRFYVSECTARCEHRSRLMQNRRD